MPLFRSKPKVIDAEQYVDREKPPRGVADYIAASGVNMGPAVTTIQGMHVGVEIGEWIVDEGDGVHFYPIADAVFKGPKGYEPISKEYCKMISPTVGRVVWFYPSGHPKDKQPLAAIVAHVWSDTCVNLAVFDANGRPMENPPTSVLLIQDENEVPTGGIYCTWMPYQKAVASGQIPPTLHKAAVAVLAFVALLAFAPAADAKILRGAACANGSCSTALFTIQAAQPVIVQPPPVIVQPAPTAVSSGCQGSAAIAAGGCAGNQGSGCAGGTGGNGRKLFSGGLLHRARSDSGGGLFARHRNRGSSSGYEATTTTRVQTWDNRPAPALVVVPPQAPAQAPPARGDNQP